MATLEEFEKSLGYYKAANPTPSSGVDKTVQTESGGNPNATSKTSSATGDGGFIKSTWLGLVDRFHPEWKDGLTEQQVLDLRTDPEKSREMIQKYRDVNSPVLEKAGVPVSDTTLYMGHNLDGPVAARVWSAAQQNPNAPIKDIIGDAAYNANLVNGKFLGLDNPSVGNYVNWAAKKMGEPAPFASGPASSSGPNGTKVTVNKAPVPLGSPDQAPGPTPAENQWGQYPETFNNLTLGAGVPAYSVGAGVVQAAKDIAAGQPVMNALGGIPQNVMDVYKPLETDRREWRKEHPVFTTANELAATLAPMVKAGQVVNEGIKAGTKLAGQAVPIVEDATTAVGRLLTGQAGRSVETGQALPGAAEFLARRGSDAVAGGIQGLTGAAVTAGLHEDPILDQLQKGATWGAGIGAATTPVIQAATAPFRAGLDAGKERLMTLARQYGIPMRGGQMADEEGNWIVRQLDKLLASGNDKEQLKKFTEALGRELGEQKLSNINLPTLNKVRDRIGKDFDKIAAQTQITYNNPIMVQAFQDAINDFRVVLNDNDPVAKAAWRVFVNTWQGLHKSAQLNGGRIPGADWQQLLDHRSQFGRFLDKTKNMPTDLEDIMRKFKSNMDDMFDTYAPPGTKDDLMKARREWRTSEILKPIVEKNPTGTLDPTALVGSIASNERKIAGKVSPELRELGEIGQILPKPTKTGEVAEETAGRKGKEILDDILPYHFSHIAGRMIASPVGPVAATIAASPLFGMGNILQDPKIAATLLTLAAGTQAGGKALGKTMQSQKYFDLLRNGGYRPEKNWLTYPTIYPEEKKER